MLLAAMLDAGARLETVQSAVDAVIPRTVRLAVSQVHRASLRAAAVQVELLATDQPHRTWAQIRSLLQAAPLADGVRTRALAVFAALAQAEARVHGVGVDDVGFHEVGSWDSIADVVGVCAAVHELQPEAVVVGELALGSGSVRTQHGVLPVPVPAVIELCRGWSVASGGDGELATPSGVALVTTLASDRGPLPRMILDRVGTGAGTRDRPDRPNVVRVLLGHTRAGCEGLATMALLETNIDDLDPRVWPSVIEDLLTAGAVDAWLTPAVMKKGRPGHVLGVLSDLDTARTLRRLILDRTPALGVRQSSVAREVLARVWVDVPVPEGPVPVKIGHRDGVVVHVMPEFEDVARLAAASGRPVRQVLDAAVAAAATAGLIPGAAVPLSHRPHR